jgi:hypothetical protein
MSRRSPPLIDDDENNSEAKISLVAKTTTTNEQKKRKQPFSLHRPKAQYKTPSQNHTRRRKMKRVFSLITTSLSFSTTMMLRRTQAIDVEMVSFALVAMLIHVVCLLLDSSSRLDFSCSLCFSANPIS